MRQMIIRTILVGGLITFSLAAMKLSPFNAEYAAASGRLLLDRAAGCEGKARIYWLEKAEDAYRRALRLDPRSAEYALKAGQADMRLFLYDNDKKTKARAFDWFKRALRNDPNGFNVSYSAGYAGLVAWDALSGEEKALVLDRLRYTMQINPRYGAYLYPLLWEQTKDFSILRRVTPDNFLANWNLYSFLMDTNLGQFLKSERKVLNFCRQRELPDEFMRAKAAKLEKINKIKESFRHKSSPSSVILAQDWKGTDATGKSTYQNGCMYWSGTMDAALDIPNGEAVVKIQAMGTPVNGVYPHMVVEMDGEEIGEAFVDSPEMKEYSFDISTNGGAKVLSVSFENDCCNEKEDRNLYVGKARAEQESWEVTLDSNVHSLYIVH